MLSLPNDNFNPVNFYTFAGEIYTETNNETAHRVIIGRAYYAVFLCARDYAKITNSSGSVHSDVIKHFQTRDKRIYNQMNDLKALRSKADYRLTEKILKREAGESLRLAKAILQTLKYLA